MRIRVHIGFSYWSDEEIDAKAIIAPLLYDKPGFPFKYVSGESPSVIDGKRLMRTHHKFDMFVDDERYEILKQELASRGIRHTELPEEIYDETELAAAEFLCMGPAGYWGYPQPEGRMVYWQRASYDLSTACPLCGYGAIQNRPYQIKGKPKFGRNDILALNWTYEFLVTERLRRITEDARLTGVEFWPLTQYRKDIPLEGFYQLFVNNTLPPMSPNTKIEDTPLPEAHPNRCSCGKFGRNRAWRPIRSGSEPVVEPIRYRRIDLRKAKDFNLSSEWLGLFDARPERIVGHRVYDLFLRHGVKRVGFEPIIVED